MPTHVPDDIRTLSQARAAQFNTLRNALQPEQIAVGQVWTTQSQMTLPDGRAFQTDDPRLVVVLEMDDPAEGVLPHAITAPLSTETAMASDFDLILSQEISEFGFDCMVETWNQVPMLLIQCKHYVGSLPDQAVDVMKDLVTAKLFGDVPDPALAAWTGPTLFGINDPRYAFQQAEVAAVTYLAAAATAAIELRVTAPAVSRRTAATASPRLVYRLGVTLARLSRYLSPQVPKVAYAASAAQEEDRYLIHQEDGEAGFTLELLHRQRQPYTIYIEVHQVGTAIAAHQSTITVTTTSGSWTSAPAPLLVGATITIGEEPRFRIDDVQQVVVSVEE
jgi:hypothetical protein